MKALFFSLPMAIRLFANWFSTEYTAVCRLKHCEWNWKVVCIWCAYISVAVPSSRRYGPLLRPRAPRASAYIKKIIRIQMLASFFGQFVCLVVNIFLLIKTKKLVLLTFLVYLIGIVIKICTQQKSESVDIFKFLYNIFNNVQRKMHPIYIYFV